MLIPLMACSLGGPLRVDQRAKNYQFPPLSSKWVQSKFDDPTTAPADYVYSNKKTGAYLAIDSLCNRYPDSSLDTLAQQLAVPFEQPETIRSEKRMVDEREANFSLIRGKVDGVMAEEAFLVLRKDDCIFDFTLDAKGHVDPVDLEEFEALVRGFHYRGGKVSSGSGGSQP